MRYLILFLLLFPFPAYCMSPAFAALMGSGSQYLLFTFNDNSLPSGWTNDYWSVSSEHLSAAYNYATATVVMNTTHGSGLMSWTTTFGGTCTPTLELSMDGTNWVGYAGNGVQSASIDASSTPRFRFSRCDTSTCFVWIDNVRLPKP